MLVKRFFNAQPTRSGDLVQLRPLRADDFDALYAVAADPLIWVQHPVPDRHEEASFRAFFDESLASGGALVAIDVAIGHAEGRATGRVIGSSRYHGYDPDRSEVEIGWTFLARSHWGGRYNGDMKRLMLRHAFRFVDNVVLLIGPHNVRCQRAVEKIGAVRVGTRPDAGGRSSHVYRITAEEFARMERARTKGPSGRSGGPST